MYDDVAPDINVHFGLSKNFEIFIGVDEILGRPIDLAPRHEFLGKVEGNGS